MKNDDLISAFGDISDDMIENADRMPPRKNFKKIVLVAALISLCVISVLAVGIWRSGTRKPLPVIPEETTETSATTSESGSASETTVTDGGKKPSDGSKETTTSAPGTASSAPGKTAESTKTGRASGAETTGAPASAEPAPEATTGVDDRKQPGPASTGKRQTEKTNKPQSSGTVSTSEPQNTAVPETTTAPETSDVPETSTLPYNTDKPDDTSEVTEKPDDPPDPIDGKQRFSDVKVTDRSYSSIEYVVDRGYMSGRTEDLFEPEESLTRAEYVQSLYKIAGSPEMSGYYKEHKCFHDTETDAWYYDAVLWSKTYMILNGEIYNGPEDLFYPEQPVTRADIAAAMLRMCNYFGIEPTDVQTNAEFDDIDSVPAVSRNAVKTLAAAGIVTAKYGGSFCPDSGITRAEAADMIEKLMLTSKSRSLALLEKYGLTLTYGAQYRQYDPSESSRKIVVSLISADDADNIPALRIEGSIQGCECGVYGAVFTKKNTDAYSEQIAGTLHQFVYCVERSHENETGERGCFYDGEVLTVTLKISVGGESTTVTIYPRVVCYN